MYVNKKISQVFTNFFEKTREGRKFQEIAGTRVRQDADGRGRLPVTSVRPLSDPNACGLIAANTGPPYLSLSSPLPSRVCIVMHFD